MKFVLASIVLAGALVGCATSPSPDSPASLPSNPSMASRAAADAVVSTWSRSMMRVPLPSAGCFEASYPAVAWSQIACGESTRPPIPRSLETSPAAIGDLRDYALSVSPRVISTAIGSFPEVAGVKSVRTVGVASQGGGCVCGNDDYSLQLNSNFFSTAACGKNAHCLGWEQLLYFNPSSQRGKIAQLFTQDWLIRTSSTKLTCPPKSTGWTAIYGDCYYSSPNVDIPEIAIGRLEHLSVSLSAARTGDSVVLTDGTTVYGMKDIQGDFMGLDRHWTGAEFNVLGDCCGSMAVFNPGSKITVRLEAADGSTAAPACQSNAGTTAETNSLSFIAAPSNATQQQYPSILFSESNTSGGGASCDAVAAR